MNASEGVIEALIHYLWRWHMVAVDDIGPPKVRKVIVLAFNQLVEVTSGTTPWHVL
ncbi:hypothetical protein E4U45_000507 [Claviceps purpurea]|nr:hypothetical protein E4U45_000507 [Claviceps purpurea]